MAHSTLPSDMHKPLITNSSSRFKHFSITLAHGATLTGIVHVPTGSQPSRDTKPLLVGCHGGTCSAYTFDVSPDYTASTYSQLLDVPFVAFNRPNYLDSSGWLVDRASNDPSNPRFKPKEGDGFFEEEGRWLHEYVLPALWTEFGIPNGCNSIVTLSHSMGCIVTIVAASSYSNQAMVDRKYKWAGAILYGLAEVHAKNMFDALGRDMADPHREPHEIPVGQDERIHTPPFKTSSRTDLMCGPKGLESDETLRGLIEKGALPFLAAEPAELTGWWPQNRARYMAGVDIPIMYALGEYDWIWQGSKRNVVAFSEHFINAPRVEGALVEGAPHAIDLGRTRRGWWVKCFGFAMEVAASAVVREWEGKPANFEQGEWPADRGSSL
ncbi:hypothetical protein LTR42_007323 [Elasticomyces elasticus]|nr:hypothetical protein LTR42_007323 [Elasticomyces elasticus]